MTFWTGSNVGQLREIDAYRKNGRRLHSTITEHQNWKCISHSKHSHLPTI